MRDRSTEKTSPPVVIGMRCAVCGRGFSVGVHDLIPKLERLQRRAVQETVPGLFFALTCSDCGAGGKSWNDGVLVRLSDALRPLFGEEEGGSDQ